MIKAFLISMLFTASAFANEIILQPGSSVFVKPTQPMRVTCEGKVVSTPSTICQCNTYSQLMLVYVNELGQETNRLMLQDFDTKSECFDAMKVNAYCKTNF